MAERDLDVVIYGATGYTGRLVAEYFVARTAAGHEGSWAMAGRSAAKLAAVRDEIGADAGTTLIVADAADPASVTAMVERARVVITTVGPYQLYGNEIVAACTRAGTDYVDLCGETHWMRHMIDAHEAAAQASGARIVFSCGFDSVPFDLGVFFAQETAKARLGTTVPRVKGRVRGMNGTFSGGTAASGAATMEAAMKDPAVLQLLMSPFSLTPGYEGAPQPSGNEIMEDASIGAWVAPFIMAAINTKNIHRSNMLLGNTYGDDFTYDEMIVTGPGAAGEAAAKAMAGANPFGDDAPAPGEGPSRAEREAGNYDLLFVGEAGDGRSVRVAVTGDMDPGYGSTSKMISECALCLLDEAADKPGGIYTPAPAFGAAIIERLRNNAGMTFEIEA